jgi:hypothetical protein
MPDKHVSLYLLSHAKTTKRADKQSFTLMSKISNTHGLNLQTTKSRDEAKLCLASMVALARDYVDPRTNRQTPITQCEKMRAAGVWLINGVWDPQWRMRCLIKAMHRLQPKVVPEKGVDRDVTSLLGRLRHDHFFETTLDKYIKSQPVLVRGAVLAVMALGARPGEVAQWNLDTCSWSDTFVEVIGPGKGKKELQRYRLFRFTQTPQLCPMMAMREVLGFEAAKAERDIRHMYAQSGRMCRASRGRLATSATRLRAHYAVRVCRMNTLTGGKGVWSTCCETAECERPISRDSYFTIRGQRT